MSGDNLNWQNKHYIISLLPDPRPEPEPKPMCTGLDPVRCDDPRCPVHGKKAEA